jgi:hypothetical protein
MDSLWNSPSVDVAFSRAMVVVAPGARVVRL